MEDLTPFRVGYVPGVMPGKWAGIWNQRFSRPLDLAMVEVADQDRVLREQRVTQCFVRGEVDQDVFHRIPLYAERPVVVASADHPVAAFEEIEVADLAGEHDVLAENPGLSVRLAIETVAAGTGIVIVPMSLARLHHRKDAVWRPVLGVPESPVGLAWLREPPVALPAAEREARQRCIEQFIGVVRGRTANSSR